MVNLKTYSEIVLALLPAYSALACTTLLFTSKRDSLTAEELKVKSVTIRYMIASFLMWVFIFVYGYSPEIFIYIGAFAILTFLLIPVLFFRIIRLLTKIDDKEKFSLFHYLIPILIAGTVWIWSFFVPLGIQVDIIRGLGSIIPKGYETYARFYLSASLFRAIVSIIYNTLTILTLYRYFQKTFLTEKTESKPASWIILLISVSLILLINAFVAYLVPHFQAYTSPWLILSAFLIMIQQIVLTWHIIQRKYMLYLINIPYTEVKTAEQGEGKTFRFHQGKINRKILETYFRYKKPYLNKNCKISDLVDALDVNRTVISAFINQTYGINFNRYLNHWRLKELKRLQQLPSNRNENSHTLLQKAGFSNNKHYQRTIKAEGKSTNNSQNKPTL